MNTAARIESTSKPGRIQMSKETGELVIHAGKGHWIEKREQKVEAKGKGELQRSESSGVSICLRFL